MVIGSGGSVWEWFTLNINAGRHQSQAISKCSLL